MHYNSYRRKCTYNNIHARVQYYQINYNNYYSYYVIIYSPHKLVVSVE